MWKSVQILADSAPSTQCAESTTLVKLELHGENWRIATTCIEAWNWINANNLLPPSVHLSHFLQCQLWPVFFSSSSSLAYRIFKPIPAGWAHSYKLWLSTSISHAQSALLLLLLRPARKNKQRILTFTWNLGAMTAFPGSEQCLCSAKRGGVWAITTTSWRRYDGLWRKRAMATEKITHVTAFDCWTRSVCTSKTSPPRSVGAVSKNYL